MTSAGKNVDKPSAAGGAAARPVEYLYYPGCSLHSTALEYNESTQALLGALGLTYEELKDWNCCGATPAHATSEFLTAALPLRNLVIAEKQAERWVGDVTAVGATPGAEAAGVPGATAAPGGTAGPVELLVPCAACYNSFRIAERTVRDGGAEGQELNREIGEITGRRFGGQVTVKHPLEILSRRETVAKLRSLAKQPLGGLKVACYYGCLLVRPSRIVSFEPNPEHPVAMENVMAALGAEPVRWSYKTDCCGQSMSMAEREMVIELTGRITRAAKEAGADAIVTACPLCMMNLDSRQVPAKPGEPLLPVFFYSELAALALGAGNPKAWFKRHLTDLGPALRVLEAKKSA